VTDVRPSPDIYRGTEGESRKPFHAHGPATTKA